MALDEVRLRDGQLGKRVRIDHPEASAMIPFITESEILMVRQFRYALGRETIEIPAGKVDPGEKPDECVIRELKEETGYEARRVERLYTYAPAIGYSNELIHIFSGYDLQRIQKTIDEREIASVERIPLGRVKAMVKEGRIQDGKTLLALSLLGFMERA